jgi:hypothetical protein
VGSTFSTGLTFANTYGYGATPYPGGWAVSIYGSVGGVGGRGEIGSINDGGWHHLVHSVDRAKGSITTYLDGNPVAFHKQAGTSVSGAGDVDTGSWFSIGQDPTGTYGESGSGDIDDLGVWRKALSPLEAASIYIAGVSNHLSYTTAPITLQETKVGNQLQLNWDAGTLTSATNVAGPWTDVVGAVPPYLVTPVGTKFYRVRF